MNISFGVIGGSGAYSLLKEGRLGHETDCKKVKTPFGNSAPVHRFSNEDLDFLFLSRHGEEDYSLTASFVNYRANIYALKELGVERVIAWSGPGIINRAYRPGEFVIPEDIIDETRNRESTFFKNCGYGLIRQKDPFCPFLRNILHDVIHQAGFSHHEGSVYVCTEGPRLESPAEIRKFRAIGGDLVGMTLAPETFLAREFEMCYAPLCYLVNYAEGVVERSFEQGILFEGMQNEDEKSKVDALVQLFPEIIRACFLKIRAMDRFCNCKDAMLRYKNKGMISGDWRTWPGDF